MKICFLADAQSIHTQRWCRHFADAGHEIHLISFKDHAIPGVFLHYVNSGTIRTSGGNWQVLLSVFKIRKILSSVKPDILHAQYATSYGIVGALTGYHPFVLTPLGTDVLITPSKSFLYRRLIGFALKKADLVTSLAAHITHACVAIGADPVRIRDVIFGVDTHLFHADNRKVPEGEFVITSTRNFEYIYNHPLMLEALKLVKDKIPGLRINYLGSGSQQHFVEQEIHKLGLSGVTRFFGKVPQSEMVEVLNRTHLFITLSFSDGNNISLNEAMACHVPAIASDIEANRVWIKEGENGFLVPTDRPETVAEKIMYIYGHYQELAAKCAVLNTRLIKEKASWQANMKTMTSLYEQLAVHGKI